MYLYCTKTFNLKKVIISVTNDLTTDQRVSKVCNTLCNNNFKVVLVGRKLTDSANLSRPYQIKRFNLFFNKGFLFFAEYNLRLLIYLLYTKKDILLANDLDTLLPNYLASKLQNKKLAFDSHELFPEIPELVTKPQVKKFWETLEHFLLPKVKNKYTVCKSIADFYAEKYQTSFKVIKNLPTKKEIQKGSFSLDTKDKKIIIYQGAVNVGRGLELMIETMAFIENALLIIIGDGDILKLLQTKVTNTKIENKVIFLGKITPTELQLLTPLAHLGFSLEEDLGLNYRYALPNKIFDYIQAGIPILVSNLPEMRKVVKEYGVGEIVENRSPKELAAQIELILKKNYTQQLKEAKKILIWEAQEAKLLHIFNNLA